MLKVKTSTPNFYASLELISTIGLLFSLSW